MSEACLTYTCVGGLGGGCRRSASVPGVVWGGSACGSDVYAERLCCCLKPRSSGGWDSSHEISAFQVEDGPRVTLLLIGLRGKAPPIWRYSLEVAVGIFNSKHLALFHLLCVFLSVLIIAEED